MNFRRIERIALLVASTAKKISLQEAIDRKMFGPVYHGTTQERRELIEREGFKVFVGPERGGPIQHGYENMDYGGAPAPIHHLGYGVYFTTSKSIAKGFSYGTTRGMKHYFLDVPRLETINFGAQRTMMQWWIKNGYDPNVAKIDRVKATEMLTNRLKSKFDAVWFKGKGLRRLLDGDQIVVFDPSNIYEIDQSLAKSGEIGSKVRHKETGVKGVIMHKRERAPLMTWAKPETKEIFHVKWTKGGTDLNVEDSDVEYL